MYSPKQKQSTTFTFLLPNTIIILIIQMALKSQIDSVSILILLHSSLFYAIISPFAGSFIEALALEYGNACNGILRTSACIFQQVAMGRDCLQ